MKNEALSSHGNTIVREINDGNIYNDQNITLNEIYHVKKNYTAITLLT